MAFSRSFSQVGRDVSLRGIKEEDEEIELDEQDLDEIEETVIERIVGLTEMVPDSVWNAANTSFSFSYWLIRRSTWVLGTSLALLLLPVFVEEQRLELVNMQEMHTKQVMLGQGVAPGARGGGMLPPGTPRPM